MKKYLLPAILVVVLAAGIVFVVSKNPKGNPCDISQFDTSGIILFYSLTCPHCVNVNNYIEANNVKEKVQFEEKEVSKDKCNAQFMVDLQEKHGVPLDNIGSVPFLWDGQSSAWKIGDADIINFFKNKIGQ